jgi:hypothetical protein
LATGQRSLLEATGSTYPMSVERADGQIVATAIRSDDAPKYSGGAAIFNLELTGICSSGVNVFYGSAPNRQYGITTAAHCHAQWFRTRANLRVGRTHKIDETADTQMLSHGGPGTQPYGNRVYSGAWNSSTSRVVRNGGNPAINSIVCMSGGISGERCGLRVTAIDRTVFYDGYYRGLGFWFTNAQTVGGRPQCSLQRGDSGSPVYFRPSAGQNWVTVAGTVGAGQYAVPNRDCPGGDIFWAPREETVNYRDGFAIRISSVLGALNAGLVNTASGTGGGHG